MTKHPKKTAVAVGLAAACAGGFLYRRYFSGDSMTCGDNVKLCGVLTIASGLGPGEYASDVPYAHGLWPETGDYGTSDCIAPTSTKDPTRVIDCYADAGDNDDDILDFEIHEWEKHGECAGMASSRDYLTTVCDLAEDPKSIMASTREAGGDLDAMKAAVEAAGYEVFYEDTENSQLYLSACAPADKTWVLAAMADFEDVCGDWADDDAVKTAFRGVHVGRRVAGKIELAVVMLVCLGSMAACWGAVWLVLTIGSGQYRRP
eukprot:CAMPEP_0119268808 /NCGR_PEP_ID=MMETSP1329-20130426/6464_1 /TAXON_ID=114041 /ORGANISM="Genus nov. species nov., Strain RCC1024" /LENGTH=260 /DNA_ID=CAMNT_0007268791 /DNA_START=228 /DNA_END=1007 /DNA_ORIENTATION=-